MTDLRGVCGGIRLNTAAHVLPSASRTKPISPVSRSSVPLAIRNTRRASARRANSATALAAGMPKITSSMRLNTTRPLLVMTLPPLFVSAGQYNGGPADAKQARIAQP